MEAIWQHIDSFLETHLSPADPVFVHLQAAAQAANIPSIQVSAMQGQFLHILARAIGARRILEIGTLAGFSGIWLTRALPADGVLVTLEAEAKHAEVARANFAAAGRCRTRQAASGLRIGDAAHTAARVCGQLRSVLPGCRQGQPARLL